MGGSVFAAEHGDAGQRFQRAIIALGIDHAHAVSMEDQLLAEEPGHPRLSRLDVTGDEHVASAHRQRKFATIVGIPEQQSPARA